MEALLLAISDGVSTVSRNLAYEGCRPSIEIAVVTLEAARYSRLSDSEDEVDMAEVEHKGG